MNEVRQPAVPLRYTCYATHDVGTCMREPKHLAKCAARRTVVPHVVRRPVARTRAQVYRTNTRCPRIASDFVGAKSIAQPHEPPRFEGNHVEAASGLGALLRHLRREVML